MLQTKSPSADNHPVLVAPPGKLTVLPLGGLGSIGMNNMLLGCDGQWVLLDAGVKFPDKQEIGTDLVVPDVKILSRLEGTFHGVVLTHGHEDHIGAVPFVLKEQWVPIWGPPFALGLIQNRLREHDIHNAQLRPTAPGNSLKLGVFDFQFLRVTHSIPDCLSLAIRTPAGNMLFTGDFKIDGGLPCGTEFDAAGYKAFGDEGVLLLMADSTNIQRAGRTLSEATVAQGLLDAISASPGRVFIGMFSSNVYRLHSIFRAAEKTGRKVCLLGRSLKRYLEVARKHYPKLNLSGPIIRENDVSRYNPSELVFVCTGTQGESRAALARISSGNHRISVQQGDTLLMSARAIPGNLREIAAMVDGFSRGGAHVQSRNDPWPIHTSGHAAYEELADVLRWIRPKIFVPVHGTRTFMEDHADLAEDCGVSEVLVIESGELLRATQSEVRSDGLVEIEQTYYDGSRWGSRSSLGIKERNEMAHNGAIAVCVQMLPNRVLAHVQAEGIWTDGGQLEQDVAGQLSDYLTGLRQLSDDTIRQETRLFVRRVWRQKAGKKPLVFTTLIRSGEAT